MSKDDRAAFLRINTVTADGEISQLVPPSKFEETLRDIQTDPAVLSYKVLGNEK